MKILIATDTYTFQTSGAANMVKELAQGLRRQGHEVKVLAPSNDHRSFRIDDDYYLRSVRAFYYPDLRMSLAIRDPFLKELKEWDPDLIHLHTEGSMARMARIITAGTRIPIIMTAHTNYGHIVFGPLRETLPARTIMRIYGKWIYRKIPAVITPSEKGRTLAMLQPVRDRLHVVPNGIRLQDLEGETDPEEQEDLRRQYGLKDNGCTLIMVTRLSREKNIPEILRFFPDLLQRIPRAQLLIVGDGPDRRRLQAMCQRLGLREQVTFTGRVPHEQVRNFYGLGDLYVSASTFEMHSISYLESMACGVPLLCREDLCLEGVLEDGVNGLSYSTKEEFLDKAAMILENPSLRKRMGEEAVRRAARFNKERYLQQTLDLYEEVLQNRERRNA